MNSWRFINEVGDVAYHLATTEALLRSVGNERASNTLRFSKCSPNALILGIQHVPHKIINIQEVRTMRFNIGRRPTSGPLVLFTDKQVAVQVFVKDSRPSSNQLRYQIINIVLSSLKDIGINTTFEEPYSILVNKRMLAYVDTMRINHALALSFYFNVENDEEYRKRLIIENSPEYLRNPAFYTNLKYELGSEYSLQSFIESMKSNIKRNLNASFSNNRLSDYESIIVKSHLEKHTMSEWIYQYRTKDIPLTPDLKSVTIDTKRGFITVVASTNRGLITNLMISGDFYIYPPEALEALEVGLKFAPADESYIEDYVKRYIKIGKVELYGIDVEEIIEAIRRATIPDSR